jgi:hypothetical protein
VSRRLRLPLIGAASEPQTSEPARAPLPAAGHPVIALEGDDAELLAFATALIGAVSETRGIGVLLPAFPRAHAALSKASSLHVLDARQGALAAWLDELPERMPIVCLGAAARALSPRFSVVVGRARNANTTSCDLWLGYPHERIAHALGAVLIAQR